jgi:hypothetical protein
MESNLRRVAAMALVSFVCGIVVGTFVNVVAGFLAMFVTFAVMMYLWVTPDD